MLKKKSKDSGASFYKEEIGQGIEDRGVGIININPLHAMQYIHLTNYPGRQNTNHSFNSNGSAIW